MIQPLTREDIVILAPLVTEELRAIFSFKKGDPYPLDTLEEQINKTFPATLAKRALRSILQDEPVWDRIGHRVWLPIRGKNGGTPLGVLSLNGVERTVSPEEGMRWLPVLARLVKGLYKEKKEAALGKMVDSVPSYLLYTLDGIRSGAILEYMPYILYLEYGKSGGQDPRKIFKGAHFLGGGHGVGWWFVDGDPGRHALYLERLLRAGAKKAFIFETKEAVERDDLSKRLESYQEVSRALGFRVLSKATLEILSGRSGIEDPLAFFNTIDPALKSVRRRPQKNFFITGLHGRRGDTATTRATTGGTVLYEDNLTHFFIGGAGHVSNKGDFVFSETNCDSFNTLWLKRGLFWAGAHASFLKKGERFSVGSLTFQVAGDECFSLGDLWAAVHYYKKAVALDPNNVGGWNSLGVSLARIGQVKRAIEAFKRAIHHAPEDPMGHYNLGGLLLQHERVMDALDHLAKAHRLDGENPLICARYLEALLEAGEDKDAERLLVELEKRQPSMEDTSAVHRIASRAKFLLGDIEGASYLAKRALSIRQNDPEMLFIAATALFLLEGLREKPKAILSSLDPQKIASRRMRRQYHLFKSKIYCDKK